MSHRRRGRKQGDQNGGGKGSGIRGGILERPEGVEIIGIRREKGKRGNIITEGNARWAVSWWPRAQHSG